MEDQKADIVDLAERLLAASSVTVLTGAGVSAPSGVPTFRGAEGLWKSYRPEELACPEAFRSNAELVWEWYLWRRRELSKCQPNAAHEVIAKWSKRFPNFQLITQNVDGLHERCGTKNTLRFHGCIWMLSCAKECEGSPKEWWDESLEFEDFPPKCPYCNGLLRPAIVWFGETIDPEVLSRSIKAAEADVFISAGTSSVVYPAAGLLNEARMNRAFTVEINIDRTPETGFVDLCLLGSADEVFAEIDRVIEQK